MSTPALPSSSNSFRSGYTVVKTKVMHIRVINLPGQEHKVFYRFYRNKRGNKNRKLWKYLKKFLLSPEKYSYLLYWKNTKFRTFDISLGGGKMWGAKCFNTDLEKFGKVISSYFKSKIFLPLNELPCPNNRGPHDEIWTVKPNPDVCEARSNNYKKRILLPLGKRLVYKFPNAIAWR